MEGRIPILFPPGVGYIMDGGIAPRGWVRNPQRDMASRCKEKLNARMRRASRTIQVLRERLADEKLLLQKERQLFRPGFSLPAHRNGEYPEISYPLAATKYSCTFPNMPAIYSDMSYVDPNQICGDTVFENSLELTDSEKLFILGEEEMAQQMSNMRAYRKHLQVVSEKCRKELGIVHNDISNLKRVSTELSVRIGDESWTPEDEETVDEKKDISLDAYFG